MDLDQVLSHPFLHRMVKREVIRPTITIVQALVAVGLVAVLVLGTMEILNSRSGSEEVISDLEKVDPPPTGSDTADRQSTADFSVIALRNPFGSFTEGKTKATPVPIRQGPAVGLDLAGTFVGGAEPPYAIIENKNTKTQDIFRIGDGVFDVAKLESISADRAVVDRDGTKETLLLDANLKRGASTAEGVRMIDETTVVVAESEIDSALANLPLVLTQARAVPYFKDGQPVGLRLFAIRPGSLYEKLGLRNGDILKSINGSSLGDLSQAMRLFEQLKSERNLDVAMERDRADRVMKFKVE